ncbi:MAG TPA: molybdopterin-dependent oxidoreductase [Myxococcales bacterium]|nr:molybdopterin-dependent oxidoreductase [Myxococcales bacterium]
MLVNASKRAAWLLLIPGLSWAGAPPAPAAPSVEVTGALPKTGKLALKDLQAMKPEKATWTDRGKQVEVEGVPLGKVLAASGFEPGPMDRSGPPADKRPGYKKVVLVTARDGFQSVFSCAELAEEMGPATRTLLVWKVDGKPLPPEQGPFRLVVLSDKEASRSTWAVEKIDVLDLRARGPAPARP